MRSGHHVWWKDLAFWTIGCETCGTDQICWTGGTFLQIRPRCPLYCTSVPCRSHSELWTLVPKSAKPTATAAAPDSVPVRPHLVPMCIEGNGNDPSLSPSLLWRQWSPIGGGYSSSRGFKGPYFRPHMLPLHQLDPLSRAARSRTTHAGLRDSLFRYFYFRLHVL